MASQDQEASAKELAGQMKNCSSNSTSCAPTCPSAWAKFGGYPPKNPIDFMRLLSEFIGTLLTGIMACVGVPYWHNLLHGFSALH
ncbi:hypothetical protein DFAR_1460008 [Desulfarculales bacterium]